MLNFLVQITVHGQTLGSSLGHVFRKSGLILFIEVLVCSVQTDREEGGSAVTDLSAARATIRPTLTITIKPLHTLSTIIAIFTIAISSDRSILLSRFLQCNQNPSPTTSRLVSEWSRQPKLLLPNFHGRYVTNIVTIGKGAKSMPFTSVLKSQV